MKAQRAEEPVTGRQEASSLPTILLIPSPLFSSPPSPSFLTLPFPSCSTAGGMKVKASGGIRTYDDAVTMIDAGASRIGASASVDIVRQCREARAAKAAGAAAPTSASTSAPTASKTAPSGSY